jgi:hypothetical protein
MVHGRQPLERHRLSRRLPAVGAAGTSTGAGLATGQQRRGPGDGPTTEPDPNGTPLVTTPDGATRRVLPSSSSSNRRYPIHPTWLGLGPDGSRSQSRPPEPSPAY